jgi:LysR family transcriptional regulator, hypochlorite-specific transcription factor HypT
MLDIQCLHDFIVLADLKHFGRAAEQCNVTTSGLSRRIQTLEFWIGAPAFKRTGTHVELTDAGQRLQAVASEVVFALESYRKTIRSEIAGRFEQIRLAAPHIMSAIFFPDWFPLVKKRFGNAKLSVTSENLPACFAAMGRKEEDFVVFLLDEKDNVLQSIGLSRSSSDYLMLKLGNQSLIPVSAPDRSR